MKNVIFYICIIFFTFCFYSANALPEVVITIPKTGTNLMMKCIMLIKEVYSDTEHVDWYHHWKATNDDVYSFGPTDLKVKYLEEEARKVFIIIRDPRELVCALARVTEGGIEPEKLDDIIQFPGKYFSNVVCDDPFLLKYDSFISLYEEYLQWTQFSFVYVAFFEKLVGPKGGGNLEEQIQEILNISNYLEKPLTYDEACSVANKLFGGTPTFRQGEIQDWKHKFTEKNIQNFKIFNNGLIESLGYEN